MAAWINLCFIFEAFSYWRRWIILESHKMLTRRQVVESCHWFSRGTKIKHSNLFFKMLQGISEWHYLLRWALKKLWITVIQIWFKFGPIKKLRLLYRYTDFFLLYHKTLYISQNCIFPNFTSSSHIYSGFTNYLY